MKAQVKSEIERIQNLSEEERVEAIATLEERKESQTKILAGEVKFLHSREVNSDKTGDEKQKAEKSIANRKALIDMFSQVLAGLQPSQESWRMVHHHQDPANDREYTLRTHRWMVREMISAVEAEGFTPQEVDFSCGFYKADGFFPIFIMIFRHDQEYYRAEWSEDGQEIEINFSAYRVD